MTRGRQPGTTYQKADNTCIVGVYYFYICRVAGASNNVDEPPAAAHMPTYGERVTPYREKRARCKSAACVMTPTQMLLLVEETTQHANKNEQAAVLLSFSREGSLDNSISANEAV